MPPRQRAEKKIRNYSFQIQGVFNSIKDEVVSYYRIVILRNNLFYKINMSDSPLPSRHFERSATQSRTRRLSEAKSVSIDFSISLPMKNRHAPVERTTILLESVNGSALLLFMR